MFFYLIPLCIFQTARHLRESKLHLFPLEAGNINAYAKGEFPYLEAAVGLCVLWHKVSVKR